MDITKKLGISEHQIYEEITFMRKWDKYIMEQEPEMYCRLARDFSKKYVRETLGIVEEKIERK